MEAQGPHIHFGNWTDISLPSPAGSVGISDATAKEPDPGSFLLVLT